MSSSRKRQRKTVVTSYSSAPKLPTGRVDIWSQDHHGKRSRTSRTQAYDPPKLVSQIPSPLVPTPSHNATELVEPIPLDDDDPTWVTESTVNVDELGEPQEAHQTARAKKSKGVAV